MSHWAGATGLPGRTLGRPTGAASPFVPDDELRRALSEDTADAIVRENEESRLAGLRASLFVLALLALLALFVSEGIPSRQPGAADATGPARAAR
ncbi:hypothetical protein [Nocardioides panaciterrulae]|uniref:Uncharacterized protein n=1 Tax=Nocardioides panaciterrulae TaxID=661492 RepID=A0A7Y9JCP1_9ACTN|nr:hypothetical protein [Nocardioides panaciterrulae]NYD42459.1 hypothetical protein [Nocardioides panaciterrulae]